MDAPAIADLAAARGIPVYELTPRHASLERAFMDITSDSIDYRAPASAVERTPAS
jgi:ABC-2 type transport system ATP-binding protein